MFAVVKTVSKQYRVAPGDVLIVEKIMGDPGTKVELNQVLMHTSMCCAHPNARGGPWNGTGNALIIRTNMW